MGLAIDEECFDDACFERFDQRLRAGLRALRTLLARPGFGVGPRSIGAELELFLVDDEGEPAGVNRDVLAELVDPRFGVELDRFNLEFNASPVAFSGTPFALLGTEFREGLEALDRAASHHGSRIAVVGILPTLRVDQLQSSAMTDLPRYRALSVGIRRARRGPFRIHIEGAESLRFECDDVTLEGANTSFQLHLRVDPEAFARTYNAAQIATAPVLAASGNSPFFAGVRLWEETRIALFKQAVDARPSSTHDLPARVAFGRGWSAAGAYEHFADSVDLHPVLLPVIGDEDPEAVVAGGGVPSLDELRLHHGTVWTWNRAVYDPKLEGHLRIELRALPAGPTVIDMMANAAFLVGLTLALTPRVDELIRVLSFEDAQHNFYRAAKFGLGAELRWADPSRQGTSRQGTSRQGTSRQGTSRLGASRLAASRQGVESITARDLLPRLLPIANDGLVSAGVDHEEAASLLDIVASRVANGQTGAAWQVAEVRSAERSRPRSEAFAAMVQRYGALSREGSPVHTWPTGQS